MSSTQTRIRRVCFNCGTDSQDYEEVVSEWLRDGTPGRLVYRCSKCGEVNGFMVRLEGGKLDLGILRDPPKWLTLASFLLGVSFGLFLIWILWW